MQDVFNKTGLPTANEVREVRRQDMNERLSRIIRRGADAFTRQK